MSVLSSGVVSRRGRRGLAFATITLAVTLSACSSTTSGSSTANTAAVATRDHRVPAYSPPPIPAAAFHDTTGITSSSVTVGNISSLVEGLFKGAPVGVQAYFDYINSQGGVNGRKLYVNSSDDGYSGAGNRQDTQAAVENDFATVGSFSLYDGFGGSVLAANPSVPNVTVNIDNGAGLLPNSFSPSPGAIGWQLGPLAYFKARYPQDVQHAAALIAGEPSSIAKWGGELAAMHSLGYRVVYDPTFAITQTDFTQNVIAMRNAGVKILFLEQMPENYAASVVKDLNAQNFHPQIVFGASTYSESLVPDSGGPSAIDGAYLEQNSSLFLGEDAASLPAASTFQTWVQKSQPGWHSDLYTFYGWISAELFVQALKAAGPNPTRGSVLQALRKVTSFNADGLITTSNPATKQPGHCYVISRIENGAFTRVDDPPLTSASQGYRCDLFFYAVS